MLWRCPSVRGHFSFPDFFFAVFAVTALNLAPERRRILRIFQFSGHFFAIFAAIALKLGLLLFSKELQFQFAFQCDLFIFAKVMPPELRRI
jgi:hypothetical protein